MRAFENRVIQGVMGKLEFWDLSAVSDEGLLQGLRGFMGTGARLEARVVAHLAEVEQRRLHLKAAASSLFDYCTRCLNLSEGEAFHRITAARLARKFPIIFRMLAGRSIHLSALRVLRDHLTDENHRELLVAASGKSKREVEALVATLAPRPDVAPLLRKLPSLRRTLKSLSDAAPIVACAAESNEICLRPLESLVSPSSAGEASSSGGLESSASPADVARAPGRGLERRAHTARTGACASAVQNQQQRLFGSALPQARTAARTRALEPLSDTRYLLRVSVSRDFTEKLERARDLMSHANPSGELAGVIERALDSLLEKLEKQRFAQTTRPRMPPNPSVEGPSGHRHEITAARTPTSRRATRERIPNQIRREVATRDGNQCTYVDDEGGRCPSRAFLQLHHEQPHALGGPSTAENLRLLCGPHNRLLAERDFGRAHQDQFINSARPPKPEPAAVERT